MRWDSETSLHPHQTALSAFSPSDPHQNGSTTYPARSSALSTPVSPDICAVPTTNAASPVPGRKPAPAVPRPPA